MSTWHEFGARYGFTEAVKLRGAEAVYADVELGRQSLWCDDPACRDVIERSAIGQTWRGEESLEQLWCRGQIERAFLTGQVRRTTFRVVGGPHADEMVEKNQAVLDAALGAFSLAASVHGSVGGGVDDGDVAWSAPLEVLSEEEARAGRGAAAVLEPGIAPLEIGYTLPSRTLAHLFQEGAVWRWPYGSEQLWLLAAVELRDEGWCVWPFGLDIDPERLLPSTS